MTGEIVTIDGGLSLSGMCENMDFALPPKSTTIALVSAHSSTRISFRWKPTAPITTNTRTSGPTCWKTYAPRSRRRVFGHCRCLGNEVAGLSVAGMTPCYEEMNRSIFGPVCFNSAAPDDGNMIILNKIGTDAQKERWLQPIIDGKVRSSFAMTEPSPGRDLTHRRC